jgi:murein DD-endopeptidase MepM/ murein hydrolase activator NlpD
MSRLKEAAPGVDVPETGEPEIGPVAIAPSSRWVLPLLDFGQEEVPGIHLQPFGNPRKNETHVHTGQDVGGGLDGAGLHALGDGFVRFVHTGSDCGTLIVVEHRFAATSDAPDDPSSHFTAVYMHAGGTVYVAAGDVVTAGQLLGTVGLSFSIENGCQFSHLHVGLYRGPFRVGHNYGYQPMGEALGSWLDPAEVLPRLVRGEAPFDLAK